MYYNFFRVGIIVQCLDNHFRIVTVRQIARQRLSTRQRMNHQHPVADAFRRRQLGGVAQHARCFYLVLHISSLSSYFLVLTSY